MDKFIKWLAPKGRPSSGNGGFELDWLFGVKGLIFLLVLIIAALLLLLPPALLTAFLSEVLLEALADFAFALSPCFISVLKRTS